MLENKKKTYKIRKWIILLLVLVCFGVGIFQLFKYVPSIKEAIILATTVKPETFTELYFENHLSLSDKIILFNNNNFKFTIHNLENKDMEYSYEVYINMNGEKQVIDKNTALVKNNEYKTISENFIITVPIQRVKIVVNLIGKNQQIDFWMTEEKKE